MSERVLVFGVTGIEKDNALARFSAWCRDKKSRRCKVCVFRPIVNAHSGRT